MESSRTCHWSRCASGKTCCVLGLGLVCSTEQVTTSTDNANSKTRTVCDDGNKFVLPITRLTFTTLRSHYSNCFKILLCVNVLRWWHSKSSTLTLEVKSLALALLFLVLSPRLGITVLKVITGVTLIVDWFFAAGSGVETLPWRFWVDSSLVVRRDNLEHQGCVEVSHGTSTILTRYWSTGTSFDRGTQMDSGRIPSSGTELVDWSIPFITK